MTLNAPRLREIKLVNSDNSWQYELSVERLVLVGQIWISMEDLKNLNYLDLLCSPKINLMDLPKLNKLEELHLQEVQHVSHLEWLLQHKPGLRVYRFGCLLNGPRDVLVTRFLSFDDEGLFHHLAKNSTRLVDEIPLCESLPYEAIQRVAPESAVNLLKRFTDLNEIIVNRPIKDVQHFLNLLKRV